MLKTSKWEVVGFEAANRGMRNPMNSWADSDSFVRYIAEKISGKDLQTNETKVVTITKEKFAYGTKDLDLAKRLISTGKSSDRKFLRQIVVYVDIEAPLYWWKEMDTYKVGTVADSCSTMHTIHKTPITMDMFSTDYLEPKYKNALEKYLGYVETCRQEYSKTKDKEKWNNLIQLLPSSFNQKRTVSLNYEVLYSIISDRRGHKLKEWETFINDAKANCPYIIELIFTAIENQKTKLKYANEHDRLVSIINVYKAKYGELTENDMSNNPKVENQIPVDMSDNTIVAVRKVNMDIK